jgi:hypothetical protein
MDLQVNNLTWVMMVEHISMLGGVCNSDVFVLQFANAINSPTIA